jgi:ribosomal silencing factor RsfS
MVSKKDITALDFSTLEQYFDYIVESKANGNYSQVTELINKLSKDQKKEFIKHLDSFYTGNSENVQYCRNYAFQFL